MYYSKSTRGFYSADIHGDAIPSDAVEITAERHTALLAGQSVGKVITADANGSPILADPAPPTENQVILSQIAALEATITGRRMRDAMLGTDGGWLHAVDAKIAALRKGLT